MRFVTILVGMVLLFILAACGSINDTADVVSTKQVSTLRLTDLKNIDYFEKGALEHIFFGEINRKNMVVGYHYEGLPEAKAHVAEGSRTEPDSHGVYIGKVYIGTQVKEVNRGYSSFYPLRWSPQQVVDAINYAYERRERIGQALYMGISEEGVPIQFYLHEKTKKIMTAYPVYKSKR